jgi:phenylacetate-CoA ligase
MGKAGLAPEDVRTPEEFARIPVLRKKEVIELQAEEGLGWMLTVAPGRLRRIYQSPGPILDPEGAAPDYWGWTEAFYAAGFRPGDLVQMTFSYHLTPAGHMLEEPLREIGCAVIPAGPGNTDTQIDLMSQLPVTGFVGMASYLKVIGEKAAARGLDLHKDLNLQAAFVAAEKLTETLRAELEDLFGMRVRQGYGTADVGAVAYECPHLGGMHLSTRAWVEIVDPATGMPVDEGETGEVVVTPFADAYPLVRLATGDLSALVLEQCPCGRTSARLSGILGRVDDTAKVKGQFVYPSQAAKVMEQFPQITAWRLVVDNPGGRDALTVELACSGELETAAFQESFQARLKLRPAVEVVREIPEGAGGLVDRRRFET